MRSVTESRITAIESSQHGLITLRQLEELKLSDAAVRRRLRGGRHARLRRGVLVNPGVPPSYEQTVLAAVLAAGETAFASHETAAQLWALPLPQPAQLEISTVLERRPRVPGVRMHRSGLLLDDEVVMLGAIPVSSPERTIFELSSRLGIRALGRLVDEALRRGITTLARMEGVLERLRRAPGRSPKKMREVLRRRIPGMEERESDLEDFVFDALRRFGLPLPVAQHRVVVNGRKRRIDFCYVDEFLALEPKGFNFHGLRGRFDDDALRGNELVLAEFRVLEFTSAFTDWQIASQVAEALRLPCSPRPRDPLTFGEWLARR